MKNEIEKPPTNKSPVARTSVGLRNALFDDIDSLRNGEITHQRASAMARLSTPILNSVKLELDHERFVATHKAVDGNPVKIAALDLGT